MIVNAIFAIDDNGGMGVGNRLPWPFNKTDMAWFKSHTTGCNVIMGRRTWDSEDMPTPLPNRTNFIITNNPLTISTRHNDKQGFAAIGSFGRTLAYIEGSVSNPPEIRDLRPTWCIGGASLLASTAGLYDFLYVTHIKGDYNCDTVLDFAKFSDGYVKIHSIEYENMEHAIYERVSRPS